MQKRRAKSTSRNPVREWVGGHVELPIDVEENPALKPCLALWLELPADVVVASGPCEADTAQSAVGQLLREVLPRTGLRDKPTRVRVASQALATEARELLGAGVPIVVAPTPELAALAEDFLAYSEQLERTAYLLSDAFDGALLRTLFEESCALATQKPWRFLHEGHVLRVSIPELQVEDACLMVIGNAGLARALLLFPSASALVRFEALSEARAEEEALAEDFDMGSSVLSLSFEAQADLDPMALARIQQETYPIAAKDAYPVVEHRDATGAPLELEAGDLQVAAACAGALHRFLKEFREDFSEDEMPVAKRSYQLLEGRATVTLEAPHLEYEALSEQFATLAEAAQAGRSEESAAHAGKIGRNDLCPCGSGKKYKKCCAGKQGSESAEPAPVQAVLRGHDHDYRLVPKLMQFAMLELGLRSHPIDAAFQASEQMSQLSGPLRLYGVPLGEHTIAQTYASQHGKRLNASEHSWIEAQSAAWLGVWEMTEVVPGEGLVLRDLLTREVRRVVEKGAASSAHQGDMLLGRVVDHAGESWLCGCHPRTLTPSRAAEVIKRVTRQTQLPDPTPAARLRKTETQFALVQSWESVLAEGEAQE